MSIAATSSTGYAAPVIRGPRSRVIPLGRSVEIFDDFCHGTSVAESGAVPAVGTAAWACRLIEAGGGEGSAVPTNVAGGALLLTTDAAVDDATVITSPSEFYSFSASKKMVFEARFQVLAALNSNGCAFLGVAEVSDPDQPLGRDNTALLGTSHIGFSIINGAITFSHAHDTTATTSATLATLANATDTVLTCEYDGDNTFRAYIDGVKVLTQTLTTTPDDLMAIMVGIQNGNNAVLKTMTLDYVYFRADL